MPPGDMPPPGSDPLFGPEGGPPPGDMPPPDPMMASDPMGPPPGADIDGDGMPPPPPGMEGMDEMASHMDDASATMPPDGPPPGDMPPEGPMDGDIPPPPESDPTDDIV